MCDTLEESGTVLRKGNRRGQQNGEERKEGPKKKKRGCKGQRIENIKRLSTR